MENILLKNKDTVNLRSTEPEILNNSKFNFNKPLHELIKSIKQLEKKNEILLSAQEDKERIRNDYYKLFDFSPIGLFILDKDGNIIKVNKAGKNLFGIKSKKTYLKKFQSHIHPDHLKDFTVYLIKVFQLQSKQECEVKLLTPKNIETHVHIQGLQINNFINENDQCLTAVVDVSEKKKTSQALLKAQMKLVHNIEESTASLEKANLELQLKNHEGLLKQKALEDKNALLNGVIEGITDAVYLINLQGNYIMLNSSAAKFLGLPKEKILGKTEMDLFPKETAIELMELNKQIIKTGQTITHELVLPDRRILISTKSPYKDAEGYIVGVIGISHDITNLKKAEQERLRMLLMLENSHNEICLVNGKTFKYEYVNTGACRNLGYTPEEMKKLTPLDIKPKLSKEYFKRLVKPLLEGKKEKVVFYCEHQRANGSRYPVEVHFQVIFEKEQTYFLALSIDITERKKIEKAMEDYANYCRLNQLLVEAKSEELADLNARLEQSEKELKQLNANKDKFLYIIAHDLKSPFNNLLGTAQFLENSYDQLQPEKIKTHIKNISLVAKNFKETLEDLLDWSSFQHGNMKFDPEEINLEKRTGKILEVLRNNAEEKSIDILFESCNEPIIRGDRKMINSIIQNLVTNAIKFTCKGGTVAINFENQESEILVKISDNGIGMDEKTLNNLFQLHIHHTTVGTDNEKGTGLGLILCKEFVNKHGGKIWVESEKGVGTTFFFTLPKNNETKLI